VAVPGLPALPAGYQIATEDDDVGVGGGEQWGAQAAHGYSGGHGATGGADEFHNSL
jgi:hypothetical protein